MKIEKRCFRTIWETEQSKQNNKKAKTFAVECQRLKHTPIYVEKNQSCFVFVYAYYLRRLTYQRSPLFNKITRRWPVSAKLLVECAQL